MAEFWQTTVQDATAGPLTPERWIQFWIDLHWRRHLELHGWDR
jgi:hypothetical protein